MSISVLPGGILPGAPSAAQVAKAAQVELVIDSTNGTLGGNGSAGAPWKFASQFAQGVGAASLGEVNVAMTVTIKASLDTTDPFVRPRLGSSGTLVVTGSAGATTRHTGSVTATAATNPAAGTNEGTTITDSALSGNWDVAGPSGDSLLSDISGGQRLRIISGSHQGTIGWALASLGSKKARFTQPISGSMELPFPTLPTLIALSIGDPYVIELLPTIRALDPHAYAEPSLGPGSDTFFRTIFEGLSFGGLASTPLSLPWVAKAGLQGVMFSGCSLGAMGGFYVAHGCYIDNVYMREGDQIGLYACGVRSSFDEVLTVNGRLTIDKGTIFQSMRVYLESGSSMDWINGAVFDSPAAGIDVQPQSVAALATCYGKGNAQGCRARIPGATVALKATPTLCGASAGTNELVVGGAAATTWAAAVATAVVNVGTAVGAYA